MYSHGETFYYDIDGDDYELTVLENFVLDSKEYILAEDIDGDLHAFYVDEDEEELYLVEDKKEFREVVDYWKEECLLDEDISDFEDDEYYDRGDNQLDHDFDDDEYYDRGDNQLDHDFDDEFFEDSENDEYL